MVMAKPVHQVRFGRIRAAIWQNNTDNGPRHNVTVSRLYRDGDRWRDSTSFGRDDLPLVAKVCDRAQEWIYEHGQEAAKAAETTAGNEVDAAPAF
jgi:hypothetical protein